MPTDHYGVTHAGSLGLFDDDEENAAAIARSERHERERLESAIRRHERHSERQHRREVRTAYGGKKLSWRVLWFGKMFPGTGSTNTGTETKILDGKPAEEGQEKDKNKMSIRMTKKFEVVRRPVTPEKVYTAQDVDLMDSPWLRERGMARVNSDDAGGCHIVPRSTIQKCD